jgi:hypothetical protein
MSPAHRGYLRYSHHLHDDRTRFPPEDAPDLGKEPDPAVFLSTNAGRRLEGRRRTPVAATGCLRALATAGRRAAAGSGCTTAGSAASTIATPTPSPFPPPSPTTPPGATHLNRHRRSSPPPAHPARSGRNGADLADTTIATPLRAAPQAARARGDKERPTAAVLAAARLHRRPLR